MNAYRPHINDVIFMLSTKYKFVAALKTWLYYTLKQYFLVYFSSLIACVLDSYPWQLKENSKFHRISLAIKYWFKLLLFTGCILTLKMHEYIQAFEN